MKNSGSHGGTAAKKYEKDRRIRFNALLDRLAAILPECPVQDNPNNKWTKAQVLHEKYICLHL